MGPLLFVLFCLPFYAHGVTVSLTETAVEKLSSTYTDKLSQNVAVDEARDLVYVTGESTLSVYEIGSGNSLTLLKNQTFAGIQLGPVKHCGNYIGVSIKPIGSEPSTGAMRIFKVYNKATGDDLEFVNGVVLGGAAGVHVFTADCQNIVVPMTNGLYDDTTTWDGDGEVIIIEFNRANLATATAVSTVISFDSFASNQATYEAAGGLFDSSVAFEVGLEPNDVALNADESKAYVIFKPNNLVAVIDMSTKTVDSITGLGLIDFNTTVFDPNNRDGINLVNYPIMGAYNPSSIKTFNVSGTNYFILASDGAIPYRNQVVLRSLSVDPRTFSDRRFTKNRYAGRLLVWAESPVSDQNGKVNQVIASGARGIVLWNADTMTKITDTGSIFETQISSQYPDLFNSNSNFETKSLADTVDSRSDNRGPEPHTLAVFSQCKDKFIVVVVGFEMPGGLMYFTLDQSNVEAGFTYQGMLMNIDTSDTSATYGDLWTNDQAYTLKVSDLALYGERNPLLLVAAGVGSTLEGFDIDINCTG